MKLLFNLEVVKGNRVKARPSGYLESLAINGQITAGEFLQKTGTGYSTHLHSHSFRHRQQEGE
jgi:hypothetical protein